MILFALCLLAIVACDAGQPAQGSGDTPTAGASSSPAAASSSVPGVFFAEQRPGGAYMTSEIRGELLLDGDGCLRVRSAGGRDAVVWPAGYEPDIGGGELRVLDGEGRTVARVSGTVYMGGGEIGISDNGAVDDRAERELRERCPGRYWIAAPPVRMPRP